MDTIRIHGGHRLEGEITLHGAKNGALPLLAATLLAADVSIIENCPKLTDVSASTAILQHVGCLVDRRDDTVTVDATCLRTAAVPDDRLLVETDCPYLAPHPHRGQLNHSGHMAYTVAALAELHGCSAEEMARRTAENAKRLFGIA